MGDEAIMDPPQHGSPKRKHDGDDEGGEKVFNKRQKRRPQSKNSARRGTWDDSGRRAGRKEYFRRDVDKRERNTATQQKQEKAVENGDAGASHLPPAFSAEEIAQEARRPKRKVAVLISYSGSGYKGMQIMPNAPTIEGDLFSAFVSAGAISKANATDPKKSGLVRCARTDKGVHAAGNVVSLKLIVEDEDIVEKINNHLPAQIRVLGFIRTIGSFSCYAACDSRWYEYLIPTHCFLPPNPSSWLGKQMTDLAKEVDDLEGYESRQGEELNFWKNVDEKYVAPIMARLDDEVRVLIHKALYDENTGDELAALALAEKEDSKKEDEDASEPTNSVPEREAAGQPTCDASGEPRKHASVKLGGTSIDTVSLTPEQQASLDQAVKDIKEAYHKAKVEYRLTPSRLERVKLAFSQFKGTSNYHNYTIRKSAKDPSAKRHIKSFEVNGDPKIINGTEWLSLKVHGQSFMMHQIRKMVSMATLVVRCGTPVIRIPETFEHTTLGIPKAPGLGLLLERPVFDTYNKFQAQKFEKEPIDFSKYEDQIEAFKQKEIYTRIFEEDAKDRTFHHFFTHIDGYRESSFLYFSSKGLAAAKYEKDRGGNKESTALIDGSDSEAEAGGAQEG